MDKLSAVRAKIMANRVELIIVAVLFAAAWLFVEYQPQPRTPVNVSVPAAPAPIVARKKKIATPIKARVIRTYAPPVKRDLHLPEVVQADEAKQVLESSQVPADDHPQTITTVINTDTGETETYVKRDPLPWLAWDTRGEAGVYAGFKNGGPALRLEARQGFFAVKALHAGAIASLDQPIGGTPGATDAFVGIGVWMRW